MDLIACHDCDLLQHKRPIKNGQVAKCVRCGAMLYCRKNNSLELTLMFTLAGLIFYILANVYPFMTFDLEGRTQENNLITGVKELYEHEMVGLSILVFLTSVLVPLLKLSGMAFLLLPLRFNRRPWKFASIFRMVQSLHPWAMMEVYMLGVLVAYVKLADMATIIPGIALFSFAILIFITAAADAYWDPNDFWDRMEGVR
jgi:paraquat-inducible protein A